MGQRQYQDLITILDAATTGTGNNVLVQDFQTIVFQFGTAGSATLTVKFQGSVSDTCPDFSAAQSTTNSWDYIDTIDLTSGSAVAGATGVSASGTDVFKNLEINVGGLKWINATITSRSGGSVTVKVKPFYR